MRFQLTFKQDRDKNNGMGFYNHFPLVYLLSAASSSSFNMSLR